MSLKILIADDNVNDKNDEISRLPEMLQEAGYEVLKTSDALAVYDLVLEYKPDLVVLDIQFNNQPINGFEICEAIRQNDANNIPIILITAAMSETGDILRGFEAGADDYMIRSWDNREIMARIRANLPPETTNYNDYLRSDKVTRRVCVKRGGIWQEVHLPPLEFELLDVLTLNAEQVVLTTTLKNKVWGKPVSDSVLAVYIRRLREKLEPDPVHPVYIETIKGLGYRFNGKPARASGMCPENREARQ